MTYLKRTQNKVPKILSIIKLKFTILIRLISIKIINDIEKSNSFNLK